MNLDIIGRFYKYVTAFDGALCPARSQRNTLYFVKADELMLADVSDYMLCFTYYRDVCGEWLQHDTEKPVSVSFQPKSQHIYTEQWSLKDKLHRVNGPAFSTIDKNGTATNSYMLDGKLIYSERDGLLLSSEQDKKDYELLCRKIQGLSTKRQEKKY